jgi:hypothetical protein
VLPAFEFHLFIFSFVVVLVVDADTKLMDDDNYKYGSYGDI